jgi:hypothetical protein
MESATNALRVLTVERDYAFGELEGCMLGVWRGQPTVESFSLRGSFLTDLAARLPGRCGYLEVIEPRAKPPAPPARKVAADIQKKLGKSLACVGMVIEGDELRSTLIRAVIAGMNLLLRTDHPMRLDKDVLRCAEWVSATMGSNDADFPRRLVAALETLRARMPRD